MKIMENTSFKDNLIIKRTLDWYILFQSWVIKWAVNPFSNRVRMFWLLLHSCQQDGGGRAGDMKDWASDQLFQPFPDKELLGWGDGGPGYAGLDATWQLEVGSLLTAGQPADRLPAEDDDSYFAGASHSPLPNLRGTFSWPSFSGTLPRHLLRQLTKLLVWLAAAEWSPPPLTMISGVEDWLVTSDKERPHPVQLPLRHSHHLFVKQPFMEKPSANQWWYCAEFSSQEFATNKSDQIVFLSSAEQNAVLKLTNMLHDVKSIWWHAHWARHHPEIHP